MAWLAIPKESPAAQPRDVPPDGVGRPAADHGKVNSIGFGDTIKPESMEFLMPITFQLPQGLEEKLRAETPDIDTEAKHAYALELFRQGKLSHCELAGLLGLDRFQMDAYLQQRRVIEGSLTMQDLDDQTGILDRVLGPVRR